MASKVEVLKPETSPCEYEYLVLENSLSVLLVSNPNTEEAAAALDCGVGQCADPPELPGLAHFLEHMLFLGTEKYPNEDEYMRYICSNGGLTNAFTAFMNTNYMFSVNASALEGALDRFAQFFIAPLFTESATERELMAVQSEYEKNQGNDMHKFFQFLKDLLDPSHPFASFGSGNLETLRTIPQQKGINVREELLKFYRTHYSANIMKLCVYGKEDIPTLRKMVEEKFSAIPNRNITNPVDWDWKSPFDPSKAGKIYHVTSVNSGNRLQIFWVTETGFKFYRSKPCRYTGHLLGHECEGSVLWLLKKKGWADELVAGSAMDTSGTHGLTEIEIYLTEEGLRCVLEVIDIVFQYLALLRKEGFSEEVWQEVHDACDMEFRFRESSSAFSHASLCALSMTRYPPEHILCGDLVVFDKDKERIETVLQSLVPENALITIKRPTFDDGKYDVIIDRVSRFHGTRYGVYDLEKELLEQWANPKEISPELRIHSVNPFIPTDFTITPLPPERPSYPELVYRDILPPHTEEQKGRKPEVEVYHWQDTRYKVPKTSVHIQLMSPVAYSSPRNRILMRIYVSILKEISNVFTYYAETANLHLDICSSIDGVYITGSGFSQKLPLLLEKVLELIDSYQSPTDEMFRMWHQKIKQKLNNLLMNQPYEQAAEITGLMTHLMRWSLADLLEVVDTITRDDLEQYIKAFRSSLKFSMLVIGNIDKQGAVDLVTSAKRCLLDKCQSMPYSLHPNHPRIIQLPKGLNLLVPVKATNSSSPNSSLEMYFQFGVRSPRLIALVDLFSRLVDTTVFSTLRTKEQMGYIVFAGVRSIEIVEGYRIVVQSAKCSPWYIYSRVHHFLEALDKWVLSLGEAEFQRLVAAEIEKREDKPKTLKAQGETWWADIERRTLRFTSERDEIEALRTLKLQDLLDFYNTYVSSKSTETRRMTVMVYGEKHASEVDELAERWKAKMGPAVLREKRALDHRVDLTQDTNSAVVSAIANRELPPDVLKMLEEQGVTPQNVSAKGIPAELVEALSSMLQQPGKRGKVVAAIRSGALPQDIMESLSEVGITPENAAERDIPEDLFQALCAITDADTAQEEADQDDKGTSRGIQLELSDGLDHREVDVAYVLSYGMIKLTCEAFPAWQLKD